MRDAVSNRERWERRRAPTRDASTDLGESVERNSSAVVPATPTRCICDSSELADRTAARDCASPLRSYLRYSSRKAKSGHGPARVVGVLAWPRHTNCTVATAPLDPCARGTSAQRGNTRTTYHLLRVALYTEVPVLAEGRVPA